MLKLDYNPCAKKHLEWLSKFSPEQQQRIKDLGEGNTEIPKLIKLKRNRKPVEVHLGDVFLVSNKQGLYFYGKVIRRTNSKSPAFSWSKESFVAFIFKCTTVEKNLNSYLPNYDDCVCGPDIFDVSYWEKGYFEIIGNVPLTKEEKKMDIGFFDNNRKWGKVFIDSQGKILSHFPQYFGSSGFTTVVGVSLNLSVAYITNPSLLNEHNNAVPTVNTEAINNSDKTIRNFKIEKSSEITEKFQKEIAPFIWVAIDDGFSVCLNVGHYLQDLFASRTEEGFWGNGYDWESLARVFLEEKRPNLLDEIDFDSEAGMFCAYSDNKDALAEFVVSFKKTCENKPLIAKLFSMVKID